MIVVGYTWLRACWL